MTRKIYILAILLIAGIVILVNRILAYSVFPYLEKEGAFLAYIGQSIIFCVLLTVILVKRIRYLKLPIMLVTVIYPVFILDLGLRYSLFLSQKELIVASGSVYQLLIIMSFCILILTILGFLFERKGPT